MDLDAAALNGVVAVVLGRLVAQRRRRGRIHWQPLASLALALLARACFAGNGRVPRHGVATDRPRRAQAIVLRRLPTTTVEKALSPVVVAVREK